MPPPTITQAHPPMALPALLRRIQEFPSLSLIGKQTFIDDLVSIHPTLNLEWGPGHYFRRARKLDPGQILENVDDIIWPKNAPAKIGRANPAGFQVLYLSDHHYTALREINVEHEWAAIAEFEIRKGCKIHICPIGEMYQIVRTGRGFLLGDPSDTISNMLNACGPDESKSLVITDAFLHEQMVGHDDYEISSHVAAAIFKKLNHVSAIAFSSRRRPGALNLAVRTDTFWGAWGLLSTRRVYADHLAFGFYRFSETSNVSGIYNSGKFVWKKASNDDSHLLLDPPFFRERSCG